MAEIPSELTQWFAEHEVKEYRLIEHNPRKGRWCFSYVDKEDNHLFLKWNDQDEVHKEFLRQFEREKYLFELLDGTEVTPKYYGDEQVLLNKLVTAKTLRESILTLQREGKEDLIPHLVVSAVKKWEVFVKCSEHINIELATPDPIWEYSSRYLCALLLSAPWGDGLGKWEYKRNVFVLKVLCKLTNSDIELYTKRRNAGFKTVHGDFHANNILIDNNEKVYIIDFEDVRKGLPELELAFMLAMVHGLVKKRIAITIDRELKQALTLEMNRELFSKVLKTYDIAVTFNHTFNISNKRYMLKEILFMLGSKLRQAISLFNKE